MIGPETVKREMAEAGFYLWFRGLRLAPGRFLFVIALAIVGNKVVCGWACPFGALQELVYSLPVLKRIERRKLPFVVSNSIRAGLFVLMLLLLFGVVGGRRGFVLYHGINPFNLFDQADRGSERTPSGARRKTARRDSRGWTRR